VDEKFWETAKEKYDLSEDFSDSGDLLRLVLSYLWSEGNSKAIRMQSIYTFHRSMWMTSIFLIVISTGFLVENYMKTGAIIPLYSGLLILSIFGAWLFYSRKKKFSEKFIQYCITDFYQREA
jgi:LPXTG-motif cell wall-anchored protein